MPSIAAEVLPADFPGHAFRLQRGFQQPVAVREIGRIVGMVLLPRLIPRNIAVGMMMTGRRMPASEMARFGLLNAVVPFDELDAEVDRWVADILASAPLSLRAIKAVVRETASMPHHLAYEMETAELVAALGSEDAQEGVTAFREKRSPVWQGR